MGQILRNASIFSRSTIPGQPDRQVIRPKEDLLGNASKIFGLANEVLTGPIGGLLAAGIDGIDKAGRDTPSVSTADFFGQAAAAGPSGSPPPQQQQLAPSLSQQQRKLPAPGEIGIPLPGEQVQTQDELLAEAVQAGQDAALADQTGPPQVERPSTSPVTAPGLPPETSPVPAPELPIEIPEKRIAGMELAQGLPETIQIKTEGDVFALAPFADTAAKRMKLLNAIDAVSGTSPSSIFDLVTGGHKSRARRELLKMFPSPASPLQSAKVRNLEARTAKAIADAQARGDITKIEAEKLRQMGPLTRSKIEKVRAETRLIIKKTKFPGKFRSRGVSIFTGKQKFDFAERESRRKQKEAQKLVGQIDKGISTAKAGLAQQKVAEIVQSNRAFGNLLEIPKIQKATDKVTAFEKGYASLKGKKDLTLFIVKEAFPNVVSGVDNAADFMKEVKKGMKEAKKSLRNVRSGVDKTIRSITKELGKIRSKRAKLAVQKRIFEEIKPLADTNKRKASRIRAAIIDWVRTPSGNKLRKILGDLEDLSIDDFMEIEIGPGKMISDIVSLTVEAKKDRSEFLKFVGDEEKK